MSIREDLAALFDADRALRELHAGLLTRGRAELVKELGDATRAALAMDDEVEGTLRLARIAVVLGDLEGEEVADLLIDILGSASPEARVAAGESLEGLAFDRFKEVALAIERAVERLPKGSPALSELPFLLAEVGEPGCVKLLGRFLKHSDADAVAAAIEALAELGDPSAIPLLAPLERDSRQVQLDDENGEGERVGLGDLAHEAREMLEDVGRAQQGGSGSGRGEPPGPPRGKKGRGQG